MITGVMEQDEWGLSVTLSALWFLICESRKAPQVAPIGTGGVGFIEMSKFLADPGCDRRVEGSMADVDPGLKVTGAGLDDGTWGMPVGAHLFDCV